MQKRIIALMIQHKGLERKLIKLVMMSLFILVRPVQRQHDKLKRIIIDDYMHEKNIIMIKR